MAGRGLAGLPGVRPGMGGDPDRGSGNSSGSDPDGSSVENLPDGVAGSSGDRSGSSSPSKSQDSSEDKSESSSPGRSEDSLEDRPESSPESKPGRSPESYPENSLPRGRGYLPPYDPWVRNT